MGLAYRLRQFWQDVWGSRLPLPAEERVSVTSTLSEPEQALFYRQHIVDQWHSLRVWHELRESGHDDRPLLAAALLHDVGKSQFNLSQIDRLLPVVFDKIMPGVVTRWGNAAPRGWRRPFVIKRNHAEWGAVMAQQAGSHLTTVFLIRHHQDEPPTSSDPLLHALRLADDAS